MMAQFVVKPQMIKIIIDKAKIYGAMSRSAKNPNLPFNIDNFLKSIVADDLGEEEQNNLALSKSEDFGHWSGDGGGCSSIGGAGGGKG